MAVQVETRVYPIATAAASWEAVVAGLTIVLVYGCGMIPLGSDSIYCYIVYTDA